MAAMAKMATAMVMAILALGLAMAPRGDAGMAPPRRSSSPSPCERICPSNPQEFCDFFFAGHEKEVPTFHLADSVSSDESKPLSPGLRTKKVGGEVTVKVEVDESGKGEFKGCRYTDESPENQFYLNGEDATLRARTYQNDRGFDFFINRCIVLPVKAFSVVYNGNGPYNVPPDTDGMFPSSRRCVVFKTEY